MRPRSASAACVERVAADARRCGGRPIGPLTVTLELTSRCNQRCVFCASAASEGKGRHLELARLDRLCRQLRAARVLSLTLTGGEPTCHPDFLAMIECIKACDLGINLLTNGVALTDESVCRLADLLEPWRDDVRLSVDAACRGTYRYLRGADDYDRVVAAAAALRRTAIPFATFTVALRDNLTQIPDIIARARAWGAVEALVVSPFPLPGTPRRLYPGAATLRALYRRLARTPGARVELWSNRQPPSADCSDGADVSWPCTAGQTECAIDVAGNVARCQLLLDRGAAMGTLDQQPLDQIWRRLPRQQLPVHLCRRCRHGVGVAGDPLGAVVAFDPPAI